MCSTPATASAVPLEANAHFYIHVSSRVPTLFEIVEKLVKLNDTQDSIGLVSHCEQARERERKRGTLLQQAHASVLVGTYHRDDISSETRPTNSRCLGTGD